MRTFVAGYLKCKGCAPAAFVLLLLQTSITFATTYSASSYPFSWIDASKHTKLGPTTGGIYSASYKFTNSGGCGTSPPVLDDTISDLIPLGFTFKYGSKSFTSVRVMTNGRLQFDNNTCSYGSPATVLPYPVASLNYSMRIYGNDMDPTLSTEKSGYSTNCTSRSSCYISYATIGTAPNRQFVVTWRNVPEWAAANSATGSYNLQMILLETGEFIYQYGDSTAGPQARLGQIGWQLDVNDYAVAGTGFPADNSAFLFYIPNSGGMKPGAFNAFDTSTWGGANTGVIQTKIAGTPFSLDVVALNSVPSVLTTFTGAVKVELVDANSSAACSSMTSIQTVTSSYTFVAAEKGRHTFSNISQARSYPKVLVRIGFPAAAPTQIVCSTDQFAIRPSHFVLIASDSNWTTAGTTRTLQAASVSATPTHKAGHPFTLTVTPYNSLGAIASDYQGTPVVSSLCVLPATDCVVGNFTAGSFSLSGGVSTSTTASYSEVGAISISAADSDFARVDAADGSTLSQRSIQSALVTVGRFVPDHFDVDLNTPEFAPACGTFSYIGQGIKYSIQPVATVMAKNAANVITGNYKSSLWKIDPTDASYGILPSYSEASQALTLYNVAAPTVTVLNDGSGRLTFADTVSAVLSIQRANPIAVMNAEIAMSFNLQDKDAVTVANIDGIAAGNPVRFGRTASGQGIGFTSGYNSLRWGRLAMQNAHGTELEILPVPLRSEYFNGTGFVKNPQDNCTVLNLNSDLRVQNNQTAGGVAQSGNTSMRMTPAGSSRASLANTTLSTGEAGLSFSAPGSGNTGYINIYGQFSALPWLLFDWDNDGAHDDAPSARATFGLYKGNNRQIYLREMY